MKQDIKTKCVENGCGKEFVIDVDQQEFCERNKYPLPKRCEPCRAEKKRRYEVKERTVSLEEIRENSPFKAILDQMSDQKIT